MQYVPADNVAQVELRYLLAGQRIENVLYFEFNQNPTADDLGDLGSQVMQWADTSLLTWVSEEVTLDEVYVTDLSTQTSPTATVTPLIPIAGSIGSPSLPNNVALCVSFRTGGRGRSARGRNYVPGLAESQVTNNTVNQATVTGLSLAYQQLLAGSFAPGWVWVVVSKFHQGQPRQYALTQPVTAVVITDPTVDSQRRRLPGRGR